MIPQPTAVVAIGSSAGGLKALTEFLESLPDDTGMAFVVVQHLAADHESLLTTLLARKTPMRVFEALDGLEIEANTLYVMPPNRSMVIEEGRLSLRHREPGLHLAVDIFFNALADSHGPNAVGIVLSGSGSDGMKGIEALKAAGGITFAQDGSAQHMSMPQSAISTGCIDFVASPRNMAIEIGKLASVPELAFSSDPVEPAESVASVLNVLRETLNIDFTQYKENTLHRRIRRRMALRQIQTLPEYAQLLSERPHEVEALCQDILISVTSFFRDPQCFDALKATVFPRMLARHTADDPIRIWCVGCSTGEEAYSLVIALTEYMEETNTKFPLAVFGTDVNAQCIERARRGWFAQNIEQDVTQKRLQRYFTPAHGGYLINKSVRDLCVFAPHNALTEPPFSRMDLVSCRNLLIYFQASLQNKLLPTLHYALRPHGLLLLGASESITQFRDLFGQLDARHKIYTRRTAHGRGIEPMSPPPRQRAATPRILKNTRPPRDSVAERQRHAELVALKHYAPAGVLIDGDGEIMQFRGDTSPYLKQSDGRASLNLLKIAREGLFASIRSALQHGLTENSARLTEHIVVRNNDGLVTVSLNVIPVLYPGTESRWYWVFFEPAAETADLHSLGQFMRSGTKARLLDDTARQVAVLNDELTATREHLEATIQMQEAANEDLQAANEEVQSANEELQSTNEELETSKEEIQSSNEELTTVNDELRMRNNELDLANDDLNNLFSSVQLAVVMVWRDLRIRRFTPLAQLTFNILPTDIGRSIGDIRHNLQIDDFIDLLSQTISTGGDLEKEVCNKDGRVYLLRLRPYRTQESKIDGAIVILIDVDTLARTKESLRGRIAELAAANQHKSEFLAVLAHELRNPLAPLRNATQILQLAPGNVDVTTKARELIERQVNHMSRLVSDLLDAARTENGQIRLQRATIDLGALVEGVVELMKPQFHEKRQSLRLTRSGPSHWVYADSTRLEQVLTNLLNNANKYTDSNGNIEIKLATAVSNGRTPLAVIQVSDDGAGIEPELLPRLFKLFVQADRSLAHSQGGLGIGLSLVRTLIELHGGSVSATSAGSHQGSTFEVRLPSVSAPG